MNSVNINKNVEKIKQDQDLLNKNKLFIKNYTGEVFAAFFNKEIDKATAIATAKKESDFTAKDFSENKRFNLTDSQSSKSEVVINMFENKKNYLENREEVLSGEVAAVKNKNVTGESKGIQVIGQQVLQELVKNIDFEKLCGIAPQKLSDITKIEESEQLKACSLEDFFSEIVKEVQVTKDGDLTRLKLLINDPQTGIVNISFILDKKQLYINISSSNELTELLNNNREHLQALLENHGYQLTEMSFSAFNDREQGNKKNEAQVNRTDNTIQASLNISNKKDIIFEVNNYLSKVIVNYII